MSALSQSKLSLGEVIAATNASYSPDMDLTQLVDGLSSDSRSVQPGLIFIALRGESFDGHDYVLACLEAGVSAAVVAKDFVVSPALEVYKARLLFVDNTLLAYGLIAQTYREKFDLAVVALTGSAGKTTSKEMLVAILKRCGKVCATQANFNNEIGVPKTLMQISVGDDFCVLEMGAAKLHDIAYLMPFAQADVGVLTNVQAAHIEGFGSLDNVAKTKAEIFTGLAAGKTAVVNLDDEYADFWLAGIKDKKVLSFSLTKTTADVFASDIKLDANGATFKLHHSGKHRVVTLTCLGLFNIANALAASAAALALGISLNDIAQGLAQFKVVAGRLEKIQLNSKALNGTLLNDSYNANPGAVKAAIDSLNNFNSTKVVVLGDMAELGERSQQLHRQVVDYALAQDIQQLYLLGEQWPDDVQLAQSNSLVVETFSDKKSLLQTLQDNWQAQQTVLIKGSRSMKMETLVASLLELAPLIQERR